MAMKRVSAYVMAMLLVFFLLAACGGNGNGGGESVQENDHGSGSAAAVEGAYIIANYYNEDGTFSALGLALDEVNSEKTLLLSDGDIFVVENKIYMVTTESLALSFYTQSSLADVVLWWTDYVRIWEGSGIISELR